MTAQWPGPTSLTVEDRLEIAELPARYCHYSDYGDYEALAALFTADVVTILVGVGEYIGVEAQVRHARDTATWTSGHAWHVVTNLWIEPTLDGAVARYYMLGMLNTGADDRAGGVTTSGRFTDHVVRTADGWRIKRREFSMDRPATPPDLA